MKRKALPTKNTPTAQTGSRQPEVWSEILRTCGSFSLRKASRVVTQLYDDFLQPTGLRSTQVVLLVALAAEGEMGLSRMAREVVMSPSTLSRTLVPLEREGLVETVSHGGRGKLVRLTAEGENALLAVVPYWQKAQEKFVGQVGASAWVELNKRLARTVAAIKR